MRSLKPTQISRSWRSWCRRALLLQNGVLELPSEWEKKIFVDVVQAPLRQVLTTAAVAKMSPSYIVERCRNPFYSSSSTPFNRFLFSNFLLTRTKLRIERDQKIF
uniref:Uncharacterized protein n=1 Tax=Nelumbo nucifera TaxID=4432 RepID=A0A822YMH2_NELNU|nr:TPA_asm: hypothetical protein HUJ06_011622 [Nelumbo nucifera]